MDPNTKRVHVTRTPKQGPEFLEQPYTGLFVRLEAAVGTESASMLLREDRSAAFRLPVWLATILGAGL